MALSNRRTGKIGPPPAQYDPEWQNRLRMQLEVPAEDSFPAGGADGDVLMHDASAPAWATPGAISDDDSRGFYIERDGTTVRVQQLVPVRLAVGSSEPADGDINQQSICFWVVDAHDNGVTPYTFGVKYHTADDTFVKATLGTLT